MHLQIPHKLSQSDAVAQIKKALDDGRAQMAGKAEIQEERWEGDMLHFAFTAQGQHITGKLEVKDKEFVIDAKLPLMLRMFEGKIEKMIAEQSKQMLG